ncbi:MAG: hypothetical protein ACRDD4_12815 [Culicoidibacterales bacterium]
MNWQLIFKNSITTSVIAFIFLIVSSLLTYQILGESNKWITLLAVFIPFLVVPYLFKIKGKEEITSIAVSIALMSFAVIISIYVMNMNIFMF